MLYVALVTGLALLFPRDARAAGGDPGYLVLGLLMIVIAAVIYFLPAIVAHNRKHPNATAILVLNLFLGWTLIGWVAALVWAATNKTEVLAQVTAMPNGAVSVERATTRACPFCAEEIRVEAIKCKHCGSDVPAVAPTAAASAPVEDTTPKGTCSHCEATIPLLSPECPKCKAIFGLRSAYTVRPLPRKMQ